MVVTLSEERMVKNSTSPHSLGIMEGKKQNDKAMKPPQLASKIKGVIKENWKILDKAMKKDPNGGRGGETRVSNGD